MAGLDLDYRAALSATGKRKGHKGNRATPAEDLQKFDVDTLINELQQMTMEAKTEQFNHWDFFIPGAMIGGAVITLLMLCCCWRLCRQSKDGAYPTLTAPPGPLVINHMVEPAQRCDPYH
jgi:hypothetical protein